jgi:hypothetical protein
MLPATHSRNLSSVMLRPIPSYGYQLIIRPRRLTTASGQKAEMALMLGLIGSTTWNCAPLLPSDDATSWPP